MKILHFSDSHLGYHELDKLSPSGINLREQDAYDSFQKVIDIAIELQPDLVIHSGDFFHRPSPANRPMIFGLEQLSRLSKANIPIVVIAGNHETPKTIFTSPILKAFQTIPNVFPIFSQKYETFEFGELVVHGVPHINDDILELEEMDKIQPVEGKFNIILLHTSIGKTFMMDEYGEKLYPPERLDLLNKFDYVALGHWHNFQKVEKLDTAWYSGSTERMSEAEAKSEKGFCLLELEKGKKVLPEFVAIPTRNWVVEEIKNCNNKSITEIETQLQKLTQREDLKDALLSIHLVDLEPIQSVELSKRKIYAMISGPAHISIHRKFIVTETEKAGFQSKSESLVSLMKSFISDKIDDEKKASELSKKAHYYFEIFDNGEHKNR
ncbi:MAG: DNA repair exonuclease [Saprospiraceae bacterium]|jgi:exonuclease SbcD|nr:DNA repair exonuclease [Saprospiraceae bacterium]